MFVAIVTHELGHYYKSHITLPSSQYGYFYQLKSQNPDHKPIPDSNLEITGRKIQAIANLEQKIPTNFGKIYHSAFYGDIASVINAMSSDFQTSTHASCRDLYVLEKDKKLDDLVDFTPEKINKILPLEETVEKCFKNILTDSINDHTNLKNFVETYLQYHLSMYNVQLNLDARVFNIKSILGSRNIDTPESIDALLKILSKELIAIEEDLQNSLKEAITLPLGQYTDEQEADELSVEWLAKIGIDPKAAVEAYLFVAEYIETIRQQTQTTESLFLFPTVNAKQCRSFYENKWLDENAKYIYVSIGDYVDPHHSDCFRVFNVDREIVAHKYNENFQYDLTIPKHFNSWNMVRDMAKKESAIENSNNSTTNNEFNKYLRTLWPGCAFVTR